MSSPGRSAPLSPVAAAEARAHMVEHQLRRRGVDDERGGLTDDEVEAQRREAVLAPAVEAVDLDHARVVRDARASEVAEEVEHRQVEVAVPDNADDCLIAAVEIRLRRDRDSRRRGSLVRGRGREELDIGVARDLPERERGVVSHSGALRRQG